MGTALRRAVEHGELVLHYQPQVCLRSGRLVGLEALLCWEHSSCGLLPSRHFMDIAYDTGLIVSIGRWVLETACRQAVEWRNMPGRFTDCSMIHVNISGWELRQPGVVEHVRRVLDRTGLPSTALQLEFTEEVALDDNLVDVLSRLNRMGVKLALDEFGTGHAALGPLRVYQSRRSSSIAPLCTSPPEMSRRLP